MILRLAAFFQNVTGWRRVGYATICGAVMSLAMPPFNLFPLLWFCLPVTLWLVQGTTTSLQAFAVGWSTAFGFLACSLYWIAASMLVDIQHFWWAIPLAVAALPAFFALYYGVAVVAAQKIGVRNLGGTLVFALLWFTADWVRGHLFGGFPWNLVGYCWSGVLPMLQITSVIGIYGLTLLTVVAASLPAILAPPQVPYMPPQMTPRTPYRVVGASLMILLMIGIWGAYRLHTTEVTDTPDVRIRLVQPNIDQKSKWLLRERDHDFNTLLELTSRHGEIPVTHVVWPETASTYYLSEDALRRQQIADHIPSSSAVLTGVIRRSLDGEGKTLFYNSLVAVDGLGRLVAGYDKVHLVPFGEFMPLRAWLPKAIKALAAGDADFSAGDGAHSVRILGLPPFSPLICYESIFPGQVTDPQDRPTFILNVTNDGWYGQTIGPYQHFAIGRVRAIEEGLPFLRAANTGISGVIDPLGRVLKTQALGTQGVIDTNLPMPLDLTFFGKMGDMAVAILFLLISFLAVTAQKLRW